MAKIITNSLFLLLGALSFVATIQGQDQSGFISIDCGLPENSNYTEKNTGINYISDANFIDSGVSKTVSPQDKTTHQQYFTYLRSFPYGTRNCYRINVTSATRYLIRASFLYGNYDGLNKLPQFDLYLGVHLWDNVKFTNSSASINYEIIHTLSLDYVHICLVDTNSGTPFISVIEMRILNNATYITEDPTTSLARFRRLDFGITNLTYRYKDDIYDRIWEPYWDDKWTQLSSSLSNDEFDQNHFKPPAVVLKTAATPKNATASLDFHWEDDFADNNNGAQHQYYFYLHFTELQQLGANQTRSFNVTINGLPYWENVGLTYASELTRYTRGPSYEGKRHHISLFRTESSSLPPIINALEIYLVKDFSSQLETQKDEVDAVTNIKRTYKVDSRNWQGDPCAPTTYKWDGVECSSFNGFQRITSLNLSSSGLTGHIPADISKLTMLKSLDLSNNDLSGSIPSFLAQLQSLGYLNLTNNNLTGSVSNELLQKQSDGLLSLSVGKNPNLCASTSCNPQTNDTRKKENNVVIAVVTSIAGILVVLVITAAVIIFRQSKRYAAATNIILGKRRNSIKGSELESRQRQYSFSEVIKMTNNFDRILGRGGFGTVYHGFIEDIQVAVKMLSLSSVHGYQQFVAEVKLLMRLLTDNYLYMHGGNLNPGLEYLHNGCKPPIIHRDVKCTNILLNENFHAKLADFGLSKCFAADGDTHVSTIVAGTPGYLDPEYTTSNRLTEKSDVYSFGVVLLRIITGQPVVMVREDMIHHISQRINTMVTRGDITKIVDSRLQKDFDSNSAWRAVEIAMTSVSAISVERPYMSDIVKELKECLAAELARKHTSCDLQNEDLVGQVSLNLISTDITPIAR
ncbi:probable LRR receptor-like serine/threonine-protein kinase At1g51860 [Arachis ipaensis]|uniref:probable LRR receptor-like serine/threonine-protein kinase At1g51860 n=1 Tax=Arachis ipaensis TaxID=130454 RepID=UPI000A2B1380|nr:probable LRR receptor-like serine/threonine-protein kinase At1g51860 [Arachis ipaensis]